MQAQHNSISQSYNKCYTSTVIVIFHSFAQYTRVRVQLRSQCHIQYTQADNNTVLL